MKMSSYVALETVVHDPNPKPQGNLGKIVDEDVHGVVAVELLAGVADAPSRLPFRAVAA
jgi:hypothetical protein